MSEQQQTDGIDNSQTIGNPAPESAPERSEPQIPEGKRIVDDGEYQQLSRQAANYKGAAPMIQKLVDSGYKTPEDIDRIVGQFKKLQDLGLDADQLAMAFGGQREPEPAPDLGKGFDPNEISNLVSTKVAETLQHREVLGQHKSAFEKQTQSIEQAAREIAGENASESKIEAAKRLIRDEIRSEPLFYDEGHPLADQEYRPYGDSEFAKVKEKVGSMFRELSGAQVREAAKRGVPTPGQADIAGDVSASTNGKQNRDSIFDMDRDQLTALVRRKLAERGGGPTSSLSS